MVQSFQGWTLDQEFAARLDRDWDLEKVRDATYKALAAAGRDRMHFRPPDEQNDHKVTCGVRADILDKVPRLRPRGITRQGCQQRCTVRAVLSAWQRLPCTSRGL